MSRWLARDTVSANLISGSVLRPSSAANSYHSELCFPVQSIDTLLPELILITLTMSASTVTNSNQVHCCRIVDKAKLVVRSATGLVDLLGLRDSARVVRDLVATLQVSSLLTNK